MINGTIFISYRRTDSAYAARLLFDRLSARFGEENIFMDVEGLDPGVDFVENLEKAISSCDVLIVLIGQQWLTVTDDKNERRLENPEDFVRLEIVAALERDVRIIPVLVQNAQMPGSREIPSVLQRLSRLNAVEIRHEHFNTDADRLARAIETYLREDAKRLEKIEREKRTQELTKQDSQIADYLEAGQAAYEREDWEIAQSNYREILKLRPTHTSAQARLQNVSQNLELSRLYGQAILNQDEGQLKSALSNLRRIQEISPNYRKVPELITTIESLLAEENQRVQDDSDVDLSVWQRITLALRSHSRRVWYLGGSITLILMLVLACWGGNTLFTSLRSSQIFTSTITTPVVQVPTLTHTYTPSPTKEIHVPTETPHPATMTTSPSSRDTATPNPTTIRASIPEGLQTPFIDDYGVPMVLVSAGSYEMGGDGDVSMLECQKFGINCERSWFNDEEPVHSVTLDEFYIDQYEITNAMFALFVIATGYETDAEKTGYSWIYVPGEGWKEVSGTNWQHPQGPESDLSNLGEHPVVHVSWNDAQTYCQWRDARLSTEAEWEKAARGGLEGALYPWGNTFDGTLANFCDTNCYFDWKKEDHNDGYADTAPISSYAPNDYGLYDMVGNVWEWTADWYDVYPDGDPNASGWFGDTRRVLRGGSWINTGLDLRVAYRLHYAPSYANYSIGFRCARSVEFP